MYLPNKSTEIWVSKAPAIVGFQESHFLTDKECIQKGLLYVILVLHELFEFVDTLPLSLQYFHLCGDVNLLCGQNKLLYNSNDMEGVSEGRIPGLLFEHSRTHFPPSTFVIS